LRNNLPQNIQRKNPQKVFFSRLFVLCVTFKIPQNNNLVFYKFSLQKHIHTKSVYIKNSEIKIAFLASPFLLLIELRFLKPLFKDIQKHLITIRESVVFISN